MDERFLKLVGSWLQSSGEPGAVVRSVSSYGTDWAGSTMDGFTSQFEVAVDYTTPDGQRKEKLVAGEEMASLWEAVVGGFAPPVE